MKQILYKPLYHSEVRMWKIIDLDREVPVGNVFVQTDVAYPARVAYGNKTCGLFTHLVNKEELDQQYMPVGEVVVDESVELASAKGPYEIFSFALKEQT